MKLALDKIPRAAILAIGGGVGLALILTALLVTSGGNNDTPTPDPQPTSRKSEPAEPSQPTESNNEASQVTVTPPVDQMTSAPAETNQPAETSVTITNPSVAANNQLPINWGQLSEAEKITLNPFNCQPDSDGKIRLDIETGECQSESQSEDNNNQEEEPVVAVQQQLETESTVTFNQPFRVNIRRGVLQLEMRAIEFSCHPVDQQALRYVGGKTPADVQAAFDSYNSGQPSSPGERLSVLAAYSSAFAYLDNFKRHLGAEAPSTTAGLWQELTKHKECLAKFKATNVGDEWTFSNGCGLDFDDHLVAVDDQDQTHQPLYLGEGRACTEAEVPFPTGGTANLDVYFTLPIDSQIVSLIADDGQPGSAITIDNPD